MKKDKCSQLSTIPSQFKMTEVGVIPEDWEVAKLAAICSMKSGEGITSSNIDQFSKYPCYGGNGLRGFTTHFTHNGSYTLIGRQGALCGNVVGVNGKFFASEHAIVVSDLARTDIRWLTFVLRKMRLNQYSESSAQPGLSVSKILSLDLAIPPTKAEQEAIAEALSDTDALIESLEQLIAKKRHLKQGAMQELLRPKDGWVEKKLEDIADVVDPHPSHRAPPSVPNGIPFVGIGDLNGNGDIIGNQIRTVDEKVFHEHQTRYDLKDELIGLGRVASIGKVVRLRNSNEKYTISPTLGVIKGAKGTRDYIFHVLNSKAITDQFNRIRSGSTRSSVGMIVLRQLMVPMPKDEFEQTAIAAILSDMDAEIAALEAKLAKARQLKQGMMQELLTGKTRLVNSGKLKVENDEKS